MGWIPALERGHAYEQPENADDVLCDVISYGTTFKASIAMARQAEVFAELYTALTREGCTITVHGNGLLAHMVRNATELTEVQKYERAWSMTDYRTYSPGEEAAKEFVDLVRPTASETIIDFGCGTGRGALAISKLCESEIILVDFAKNCLDEEATKFPFLRADLTNRVPVSGDIGFCCDVMEHLPTHSVEKAIRNIMKSTPRCFFRICLVDDDFGNKVGAPLHLTVKPIEWWWDMFDNLGLQMVYTAQDVDEANAVFFVAQ